LVSWNRRILRLRLNEGSQRERSSTGADSVRYQRRTGSETRARARAAARDLLAVDLGLAALLERDPEMGRAAPCLLYAGMTLEEAATRLGLSPRTLRMRWGGARAYLLETVEKNRYNP